MRITTMVFLRSILFDILFYVLTSIYLLLFCIPMIIFPRKFCFLLFKTWSKGVTYLAKTVIGLETKILNHDKLKQAVSKGPCILALKHQSAYETFFCAQLDDHFVIVLKKQLISIPVFGFYLKKLNSIVIDRTDSAASLKALLTSSRACLKEGNSILIFPEGTRQHPEAPTNIKGGIGLLYSMLKVPVVPVALNTGEFWGRRSFIKKPGTIYFNVLDVIPPQLSREEFLQLLNQRLEEGTQDILQKQPLLTKSNLFKSKAFSIFAFMLISYTVGHFYVNTFTQNVLSQIGIMAEKTNWEFSKNSLPYCRVLNASYLLSANNKICMPLVHFHIIGHQKYSVQVPVVTQQTEALKISKTEIILSCPALGRCKIIRAKANLEVLNQPFTLHLKTRLSTDGELTQGKLVSSIEKPSVHTFFSISKEKQKQVLQVVSQDAQHILPLLTSFFNFTVAEEAQLQMGEKVKGPQQKEYWLTTLYRSP